MRLPTRLLQRRPNAFKKDFGHIFILAGCGRFSGAAVLCAEACLRSGAGLVTLGIPKGLNSAVIKIKPKEVMTLPLRQTKELTLSKGALSCIGEFRKSCDVLVVGPGLSQNAETQWLVRKVLVKKDKPTVIDADGLNALVGNVSLVRGAIITPHPGEMARLLGVGVAAVQAKRSKVALSFSKKYNTTVVLKGHHTIVAQGDKLYVNKTGNPGMASAGSGDVLTGMIAAFLGQGLGSFEAAKYGVYIHGLAGDIAAREKTKICMIASDIIAKIPEAIKRAR